jgi:hypothetical protein
LINYFSLSEQAFYSKDISTWQYFLQTLYSQTTSEILAISGLMARKTE